MCRGEPCWKLRCARRWSFSKPRQPCQEKAGLPARQIADNAVSSGGNFSLPRIRLPANLVHEAVGLLAILNVHDHLLQVRDFTLGNVPRSFWSESLIVHAIRLRRNCLVQGRAIGFNSNRYALRTDDTSECGATHWGVPRGRLRDRPATLVRSVTYRHPQVFQARRPGLFRQDGRAIAQGIGRKQRSLVRLCRRRARQAGRLLQFPLRHLLPQVI